MKVTLSGCLEIQADNGASRGRFGGALYHLIVREITDVIFVAIKATESPSENRALSERYRCIVYASGLMSITFIY